MANINLSAEDLEELSNQMKNWAQQLSELNRKLVSQVKGMDAWRDPQHIAFLNVIETTAKQVEAYSRNMEGMGKSLKIYANQQREINARFRSQINSRMN